MSATTIAAPAVPRLMTSHPAGTDLQAHLDLYGPVHIPSDEAAAEALIKDVEAAGLRGRGGAWFPTAIKLRTVRSRGGKHHHTPYVVCNAMEGEPAAHGDAWLMVNAPHAIIDGVQLAMALTGARQAAIGVHDDNPAADPLREALAKRGHNHIKVVAVPGRYVASEESALARAVGGSHALPVHGVRPFEHGVKGAPTLVQNAETLAQLALIARFGSQWFRTVGTGDSPGTKLLSVGGAVATPQVVEAPLGTPTAQLLDLAGGPVGAPRAVLFGGYGGTWASTAEIMDKPWDPDAMKALGVAVGAGILWAHPQGRCGLTETARMVDYLARESAGQCGVCTFGLNAVADDMQALAKAEADSALVERLRKRLASIPRRGGCSLPDGAVRMAQSALATFADDVTAHTRGGCADQADTAPGLQDIPWAPIPGPAHPRPATGPGKEWR